MHSATIQLLLRRRGLLFLPPGRGGATPREIEAVLLEFAALGFAGSARLRTGLAQLSTPQLADVRTQAIASLAALTGANVKHEPLFRRFPHGIPRDTAMLWFRRVLAHYIQQPNQPCLWCGHEGSTHVLRPCEHVVCDHCYDGSNYSACPICNRHVDRSSPFFLPAEVRELPKERITFNPNSAASRPARDAGGPAGRSDLDLRFKRLDLGESLESTARTLFEDLCARKQALNPVDKQDLTVLIDEWRTELPTWLPEDIPLKENLALVLGRMLKHGQLDELLPLLQTRMRTATDVLRLIAAYSDADAALQGATLIEYEELRYRDASWWEHWVAHSTPDIVARFRDMTYRVAKPRQVKRFPVAKLSRPLRRTLMSLLERLDADALIEDMLRHRTYWVWVGEFLHPGEYKQRFPKLARAFEVVRKYDPAGNRAELFRGYYAQLEAAAASGDGLAMAELLRRRPGELARRFDHALRVAGDDQAAANAIIELFVSKVGSYSTPVLLTLYGVLPTRARRAKRRMFWPKGGVSKGVATGDRRPTIPRETITTALVPIERELLRRLADHDHLHTALIDDALADIVAPFNERTASPAAINLTRGSVMYVPPSKLVRMFLHWCERQGGERTDIDLSVAFYDEHWHYVGVCSYYQLTCTIDGHDIAKSSGDLTSAPYPDGASEFVDLDRVAARAAGVRYAVMVVNAYAGEPFSLLERAFAGLMLRDDPEGHHFDPRTVALRFALQGANGVYMPLCFDLECDRMHWLDVYSTGELAMNNVASSNADITRICPDMIGYFDSGIRLDMRALALLHAAARCERVILRGFEGRVAVIERREAEDAEAFLARLQAVAPGARTQPLPELGDAPVLALLHRGDVQLPEHSRVYALLREQLHPNLEASDLAR
jgi:hypothetical protein